MPPKPAAKEKKKKKKEKDEPEAPKGPTRSVSVTSAQPTPPTDSTHRAQCPHPLIHPADPIHNSTQPPSAPNPRPQTRPRLSAKAMLHEEHLQALKQAAADEEARKVATKVRHCQWAVTKDASVKQTVLDWDKYDAQARSSWLARPRVDQHTSTAKYESLTRSTNRSTTQSLNHNHSPPAMIP